MAKRYETGRVFKTWEQAKAYRDKYDLSIIIERWGAQTGTSYLVPWQKTTTATEAK